MNASSVKELALSLVGQAGTTRVVTNILQIKLLLLGIMTVVGLVGYFLYLKLEELIYENRMMRQDLNIIRLENVRTLTAVRNKTRR